MENVRDTFKEVAAAILPVTIVVILLQVVFIKMPFEAVIQFLVGVLFVSIGFFLFLIGVNAGLLPIGEMIGRRLPSTKKAGFIIATGFLRGIAVTVAEPDVRVLAKQIDEGSHTDGLEVGHMLLLPYR